MLALATDEDFNRKLVLGVLRRNPTLDFISAQQAGLRQTDDDVILDWAAQLGRPLLSHDVNTMTHWAKQRLRHGLPMEGLILVPQPCLMREVIDSIQLIAEAVNQASGAVR